MKLNEITSRDSRLFAKNEFGPASDKWPALSFSSHKTATDFANTYRRDRDFLLYVGTGHPEKMEPENKLLQIYRDRIDSGNKRSKRLIRAADNTANLGRLTR
jgi:hypothetical protein